MAASSAEMVTAADRCTSRFISPAYLTCSPEVMHRSSPRVGRFALTRRIGISASERPGWHHAVMDEQTFWELVDTVGADPAGFDRLADQLSDHGAADIRDFADHLARALHALDTPAHYRAVETSGTSFLGVRCAVVAAGAREYRKVLT